ncbi:MAG: hypothetical protein Q9220_006999 [cf. Caloplaca sp. 1 TL-2023]
MRSSSFLSPLPFLLIGPALSIPLASPDTHPLPVPDAYLISLATFASVPTANPARATNTLAFSIQGVHPGDAPNKCTAMWSYGDADKDGKWVPKMKCADPRLDVRVREAKKPGPAAGVDLEVLLNYPGLNEAKWDTNTGDATTWSCTPDGLSCTLKADSIKVEDDTTPRTEAEEAQRTASEFIDSQLQLEADAREALPYAFDHCTQPLGSLRQNLFSCLTCNPPPTSPSDSYRPAGVCYSCSIACHAEHELVELFTRRNFTCDCGTTRLPPESTCTLRIDPTTGVKGPVHSQPAPEGNTYNQNFQNRFCGCGELYNAHTEKGTMFQCLGLACEADGGCGEDWWHPECVLGLGRDLSRRRKITHHNETTDGQLENNADRTVSQPEVNHDEQELPLDFPAEDEFDAFICYKCVGANPWIRRYAGTSGFLRPVFKASGEEMGEPSLTKTGESTSEATPREESNDDADGHSGSLQPIWSPPADRNTTGSKRKAEDDGEAEEPTQMKKTKVEASHDCYYETLPPANLASFSLFVKEDFRDHFCRCAKCYSDLRKHPQLLEEEELYEPPLSEDGDDGRGSIGTGSLLDRGEAALNNVDRVRAIGKYSPASKGVMVYNHLKDKVKSFLQPFAESGQAVGAEDIKAYFEKLRGDEQGMKAAATAGSNGHEDEDNRREQSDEKGNVHEHWVFAVPASSALGAEEQRAEKVPGSPLTSYDIAQSGATYVLAWLESSALKTG